MKVTNCDLDPDVPVGKYVTDNEWHKYRNNVQRIVGIFYRQSILVIDGKYSSDDGLSTSAMISGAVVIREEQRLLENI